MSIHPFYKPFSPQRQLRFSLLKRQKTEILTTSFPVCGHLFIHIFNISETWMCLTILFSHHWSRYASYNSWYLKFTDTQHFFFAYTNRSRLNSFQWIACWRDCGGPAGFGTWTFVRGWHSEIIRSTPYPLGQSLTGGCLSRGHRILRDHSLNGAGGKLSGRLAEEVISLLRMKERGQESSRTKLLKVSAKSIG